LAHQERIGSHRRLRRPRLSHPTCMLGKSRKDFNVTFFFSAFFFLLPCSHRSSGHAIDTGILNIQDSGKTRDQNPGLTTPVWQVHTLCPLSLFLTAGVQTLGIFDFSARKPRKGSRMTLTWIQVAALAALVTILGLEQVQNHMSQQ